MLSRQCTLRGWLKFAFIQANHMIKPLSRKTSLVILLLLVAFSLRMFKVDVLTSVANDERLWLMAGVSLLQEGVPTAWTIQWNQHRWDKYWKVENGEVTPWLDHPPLFALLMGGWSLAMDITTFAQTNITSLRLPMVVMSVATIYFTWLLVKEIFNEEIALFVVAVYTFFPTDLIASRFILAEHTTPFLLVLGLYAFVRYDRVKTKNEKRIWLSIMSVVSVASPLMKLSGGLVPMSLALLASLRRRRGLALWLVLMGAFSILIFWIYAWSYSWDVFVGAQTAHVERPQSFDHFWSFFTQLSTGNVIVFDPTVIIGWAGLLVLLSRGKNILARQVLFAPTLAMSFVFLYVASVENYDWYKYPAYPLLAIGAGFIIYELCRGKYWFLIFFLPLVAQMLQNSALVVDQGERRIWMVLMYFVAIMPILFDNPFFRFKRVMIFLLLLLFFFQTVWYLHMLGSACWLSDCFPVQLRL